MCFLFDKVDNMVIGNLESKTKGHDDYYLYHLTYHALFYGLKWQRIPKWNMGVYNTTNAVNNATNDLFTQSNIYVFSLHAFWSIFETENEDPHRFPWYKHLNLYKIGIQSWAACWWFMLI